MQSKQGLLLAAEVLSGLDGPVKAICEATPQARHSFTLADQVNQLVSASEADPDLGTVKLSRICPFCGRTFLDQRLRINDLAVAAGGENAAKLLNLTVL